MSLEPFARDEFYVGYQPRMPAGLARLARRASAALLALAIGLPALLVAVQPRFSSGAFEFGHPRTVEGWLVEFPYPALDVDGRVRPAQGFYWLVGPGKHGAAAIVRGLDGRRVRMRGTRIERDGDAMLQIEPGSLVPVGDSASRRAPAPVRIRTVHLVGEIVDSKCHLGVMKPGEGPTHRDCAVRCLLGDIFPMLVVHGQRDFPARVALVDERQRPLAADFTALAGRPLAITGTLVAQGPRKFLSTRVADVEFIR
jgi:hypothetical protein